MDEETYTLEQIKGAYWTEFHEAGEIFFGDSYWGNPEENQERTQRNWKEFLEALRKT